MEAGCGGPAALALGPLRKRFPHAQFTRVQQRVIPAILQNDDNLVVAAPTGSGKTLLLEVAIARLFRDRLLAASQPTASLETTALRGGACKAVYVCPIKALANEKYEHWTHLFAPLVVVLETGDQTCAYKAQEGGVDGDQEDLHAVAGADIVLTTPERWDSITRRWRESAVFGIVHSVALLLLDEVHTVHETRGAALEAIVSRMKVIKQLARQRLLGHVSAGQDVCTMVPPPAVRLVATSATLPNVDDFAKWLHVPPHMVFTFTAADRPVPLTVKLLSFAHDSGNPFAFDRFLTFRLFRIIQQHSAGLPTMVFCASRKETVTVAQRLVQDIRGVAALEDRTAQLQASAEMVALVEQATDRQLRTCLLLGIAFHNAALGLEDRRLVEELFRRQYVAVLCTTTTLALGVNLPAHLVIVKGTAFFNDGVRTSLPLSEVAQMCGRAGRPGLDSHGLALILTTTQEARNYLPLTEGGATSVAESQLHKHMIEHVNAEVALHTIDDFASGVAWLRTTFFWTRLCKSPAYYGLHFATSAEASAFDPALFAERLVERVLTALYEAGCVALQAPMNGTCVTDDKTGAASRVLLDRQAKVTSTRLGRSMSRLYILFDTVRLFTAATPSSAARDDGAATTPDGAAGTPRFTIEAALALLSKSEEFGEVRLRQGDKGPLNELNKHVRYPIRHGRKGGREVREDWHKVYVLLQAPLSQLAVGDVSLRNDSVRLWSLVPRLARFLCEYATSTRGSFSLCHCSELLLRCLERRVWPDGLVLKQLDGVSETVARGLAAAGYRDFNALRGADACRLEALCSRAPPFGLHLLRQAAALTRPCSLTLRHDTTCDAAAGRRAAQEWHYHVCVHFDAMERGKSDDAEPPPDAALSTGGQSGSEGNCRAVQKRQRGRLDEAGVMSRTLLIGDVARDEIVLRRSFRPKGGEEDGGAVVEYSFTRPARAPVREGCLVAYLTLPHLVGADVTLTLSCDEASNERVAGATHNESKTCGASKSAFDAFLDDLRAIESTTPHKKRARRDGTEAAAAATVEMPVGQGKNQVRQEQNDAEGAAGRPVDIPAAETVMQEERATEAAAVTGTGIVTDNRSVEALSPPVPPTLTRPTSRAVRLPPCRSPDPVQNAPCTTYFGPTVVDRPENAAAADPVAFTPPVTDVYTCHQDSRRCAIRQVPYYYHRHQPPFPVAAPSPSVPWRWPPTGMNPSLSDFGEAVMDDVARRPGSAVGLPCVGQDAIQPYWPRQTSTRMMQHQVVTPGTMTTTPPWQATAASYFPLNVAATSATGLDETRLSGRRQWRQPQQPCSLSQSCHVPCRSGDGVWGRRQAPSLYWPATHDWACGTAASPPSWPATARRGMPPIGPVRRKSAGGWYDEEGFARNASVRQPPPQSTDWW